MFSPGESFSRWFHEEYRMAISTIRAGQEIEIAIATSRADVAHVAKQGDDLLVSRRRNWAAFKARPAPRPAEKRN